MKYSTANQTTPVHGVYELIRDINDDVHALRDSQYVFQRETNNRLHSLELASEKLNSDTAILKQDIAVLNHNVANLNEHMKEVRHNLSDIHGEVQQITGILKGMQSRFNWGLVIAGILIAALQYLKG